MDEQRIWMSALFPNLVSFSLPTGYDLSLNVQRHSLSSKHFLQRLSRCIIAMKHEKGLSQFENITAFPNPFQKLSKLLINCRSMKKSLSQ